jgi:Ca-activated chloride channel family protein
MDEAALTAIAEATGARYFRADSTESLLQIYKVIDEMEKTEVEIKEWTDYQELFPSVLWPALFLLILELLLRATWLRTLP